MIVKSTQSLKIPVVVAMLLIISGRILSGPNSSSVVRYAEPQPARRALLIGIGDYRDPYFPPLKYPKNDVESYHTSCEISERTETHFDEVASQEIKLFELKFWEFL